MQGLSDLAGATGGFMQELSAEKKREKIGFYSKLYLYFFGDFEGGMGGFWVVSFKTLFILGEIRGRRNAGWMGVGRGWCLKYYF
ncbi:hypothetical protein ACER0A_004910 [Haloimpatiens sp. FM7315]|uniref:hypothetical protein n=1 Tax=Haloimpatiens sp. FM7315 TaxID=3298609 RepID=UPI0035A3D15B